jgi:SPP1 family predicted phage head-tail adaptor
MMYPITWKVPTETATSSGGVTYGFPTTITDWAQVESLLEKQETSTGQVAQGSLIKLEVRYRPSLAITDKWRVTYDGVDYRINSIERKGQKREWLTVIAKALK